MRKSDILFIAVWSATVFGLVEGILLNISRAYPVILAPYKTSADVLWIASLVDLVLFLILGAGLMIVVQVVERWTPGRGFIAVYGVFFFFGFFAVLNALKIIHPVSVVVLSVGLAVIVVHEVQGSERRLADALRRRTYWVPLIIIGIGIGVSIYGKIYERWKYQQLPAASSDAPNVLIIVMDTVRYDRFTRSEGPTLTPNLDKIADMGVRFVNAWPTTSWTLPSHASILTGRYPFEHGADWPKLAIDKRYKTLGEYFSSRGYVTGAFSGNSAWVTPEYLGRGFLRFDVYDLQDIMRRTSLGRIVSRLLWEVGSNPAGIGRKAPRSNQLFEKFLDDYPDRPFFVLINYMDVNQAFYHAALNHPFWEKKPSTQATIEAYDDGLRTLDRQIKDLFSDLEKRGTLKNTLIVITSDHGQSFGAQDTSDHDPKGHGTSLYVEQLRVPLFVIYPGIVPAGKTISDLVTLGQIPVTITQLLGTNDQAFPGKPMISAQDQVSSPPENETAVLATLNYNDNHIQSVIWDHWQYLNYLNDNGNNEKLYDLSVDPLEENDLSQVDNNFLVRSRDILKALMNGRRAGLDWRVATSQ